MSDKLGHILLIDDDSPTNYLHEVVIKRSGYRNKVTVYTSVRQALSFLEDQTPDLIFVDINMPGLSGWDFIDEFRKLKKEEMPVIIMLSSSIDPEDQRRANALKEVQDFVEKPMTIGVFKDVISRNFD